MKINPNKPLTQFRQGDVFIRKISKLSSGLKPIERTNGKVVLALGEVTGHHHHIKEQGVMHYSETGQDSMVSELEVKEAMAMLVHEEHGTIELPQGTYKVEKQMQYQRSWVRNAD